MVVKKFTSADLALTPDDGKRREIIEGELHVSRAPGFEHQYASTRLSQYLGVWNDQSQLGGVVAAPDWSLPADIVWISRERVDGSRDCVQTPTNPLYGRKKL